MHPRLKNIIKKKLNNDLSSVSIIDYSGSIWFIDAKSKYWYLELYKKTKTLWWRLDFFENFFTLFSMEQREFVPIIIEWVEEVLSGKVASTKIGDYSTTFEMKEVLGGKILSTVGNLPPTQMMVEKILEGEVVYTQGTPATFRMEVEEILKGEAISTRRQKLRQETQVEEILNAEGVSADSQIFVQEALCHNLISKMIETITPGSNSDYFRVEDVLTHHNSSITE
jgi:hypothetical protein